MTAIRLTLTTATFIAADVLLLWAGAGLVVSLVLASMAAEGVNETCRSFER